MDDVTLVTPRLVLRPHELSDVDDCTALWADPNVTRYISGRPFTAEETWARILRYAGLWSLLGFGYWVLRDRTTGRFVGEAGLADFHRSLTPVLDVPETGWALASWAHGQGFATEAMRAVLAWADGHGIARTVCLIRPDHAASARIALKCGYRVGGDIILNVTTLRRFDRRQDAGAPPSSELYPE